MKKTLLLLLFIVIASCYEETAIPIEGDFTTSYANGDESIPVMVEIDSRITGADTYEWTFEGGSPSSSNLKNPGAILYSKQGTYTINLRASNVDGETRAFTKTVVIKEKINIEFTHEIVKSNYSPVEVVLKNTTIGEGLTFKWEFQDGIPATFTGKTPPNVVFTIPGENSVTLTVSNGFESKKEVKMITVAPYLVSLFSYEPKFEDDDYEAPVTINFANKSISATNYKWTFEGGNPAVSTALKNAYLANAKVKYDDSKALELINTQYWIASLGNGAESFSNFRRSGFPALSPNKYNNNLQGGFTRRFAYPNDESSRNNESYQKAVGRMGADNLTTRVFWDKQ